jgi:hypothetical protein
MDDEARAARYSDLFGEKHDHPPECAYCPICATINIVRSTRPEVMEHLAVAARELMLAAGMILEEAGERLGDRKPGGTSGPKADDGKLRRIDLG